MKQGWPDLNVKSNRCYSRFNRTAVFKSMYFDLHKQQIRLDPKPHRNIVSIDSADWQLIPLDISQIGGHGSNSFVFEAYPTNEEDQRAIVKICRHPINDGGDKAKQRVARFDREITALEMIKKSGQKDIAVDIISHGVFKVKGAGLLPHSFRFYVMEKAEQDLDYFLTHNPTCEQQRLHLCFVLLQSLKKLHDLGIYHRDIKPANILFFGSQCKLADLGLARFRDEDMEIDLPKEKIGPIGWLSPEAVNKAFSNREHPAFSADIDITDASDVFQLGKLFWYILHGSIPTGQLANTDCVAPKLFEAIFSPMLQYAKTRRANISSIEHAFQPILSSYGA